MGMSTFQRLVLKSLLTLLYLVRGQVNTGGYFHDAGAVMGDIEATLEKDAKQPRA